LRVRSGSVVAGAWIRRRATAKGEAQYIVGYRIGGRESVVRHGGCVKTKREAVARVDFIRGELAALRVPDLRRAEARTAPTFRDAAAAWQTARVDVRPAKVMQHRVAVNRLLPVLGDLHLDEISVADVNPAVAAMAQKGQARETIRKSITALALALDHFGLQNVARDRRVRLPREEAGEIQPPSAAHVEACARLLTPAYRRALVVLDATGARVGELEAARVSDLDETRHAWLVRSAVSKTRARRWVELAPDVWDAVVEALPPREDRHDEMSLFPGVGADALRAAIGRACRDAGVPLLSPHSLRHRRISLWHYQGIPWAEIGGRVGQRNLSVTADRYSHALLDAAEIDRAALLA
jgi:integrase